MYGMHWGPGWGIGLGWIFGVFILVLVIWAIIKMVNSNTPASSGSQKSALDILKERYARGEINKEEYEEKKRVLSE